MSRLPGKLDDLVPLYPHPYTYHSTLVRKVQDATGVVHETRMPGYHATYARRTCCESLYWHLIEPVNPVDDATVTTCLECVGVGDGTS